MKHMFLLIIFVMTIGCLLAVGNENLVIVGFGYNGENSKKGVVNTVTKQLPVVFGSDDHFRYIADKDVTNAKKAMKITTITDAFSTEQATAIGERLDASIVVWGIIEPLSTGTNMFQIRGKMLSQRSGTVNTFTTQFQNKTDPIKSALSSDMLQKLKDFSKGEIQKLFDMAHQQYTSKNYEAAQTGFQNILRIDPTNTDAYYYLGYMQYEQENYPKAVEHYNSGLEIDPAHETLLRYISAAYERQEMFNEAIDALEKAAEQNPDKAVFYNIARLYKQVDNIPQAMATLDKALEIDPEFESAHDLYAEIAYDNAEYAVAVAHLEFMSNARPENDEIARRLAICYQRTNQLDKAIDSYKNIITADRNNLRAYLNLASAYRAKAQDNPSVAKDNYERAKNIYVEAMKIDKNNPRIEVSLAQVYLDLGDRANARRWAESARQKDISVYEASIILGDITQREGIERFNSFIAIQKEISSGELAGTLYGKALDDKYKQRNKARNDANALFNRVDRYYRDALANSTDRVRNDINAKIGANRQYIDQTKGD